VEQAGGQDREKHLSEGLNMCIIHTPTHTPHSHSTFANRTGECLGGASIWHPSSTTPSLPKSQPPDLAYHLLRRSCKVRFERKEEAFSYGRLAGKKKCTAAY